MCVSWPTYVGHIVSVPLEMNDKQWVGCLFRVLAGVWLSPQNNPRGWLLTSTSKTKAYRVGKKSWCP